MKKNGGCEDADCPLEQSWEQPRGARGPGTQIKAWGGDDRVGRGPQAGALVGEELGLRGNRKWSFQRGAWSLRHRPEERGLWRLRLEVEVREHCGIRLPPLRHRHPPLGAPTAPVMALVTALLFSHQVVSNSCHPVDCSMPGFPVLHCLQEFAQTHVHWVGDAIWLSHSLVPPAPHNSVVGTFSCT